jgi:CRP/FNR family cyclic AMP-dependent transcriptional regulator
MDDAKVKSIRLKHEEADHRKVKKALEGCPVVLRVKQNRDALVQQMISRGRLEVFPTGKVLCEQGEHSDEVYLIVEGVVGIEVNGVEIARRGPVELIGEMALLKDSPTRSAKMTTCMPTALWVIEAHDFETMADEHPTVWRELCRRVSERLEQRDWMVPKENVTPQVFFGSSSEYSAALDPLSDAMRAAGARFDHIDWRTAFVGGDLTLDRLVKTAEQVDFAVLIVAPDDIVRSRKKQSPAARDNVVFEAGLFMGNVGRERVLPLVPAALKPKLPSDWASWNWIEFDPTTQNYASAASKIAERLRTLGVRSRFRKEKPEQLKKA